MPLWAILLAVGIGSAVIVDRIGQAFGINEPPQAATTAAAESPEQETDADADAPPATTGYHHAESFIP